MPNVDKMYTYLRGYLVGAGMTESIKALQYARKACQRMNQLADRFPEDTGLKARALNMAAREVLLAQSLDWPKMLSEGLFPEYAEEQFKKNTTKSMVSHRNLYQNPFVQLLRLHMLLRMNHHTWVRIRLN